MKPANAISAFLLALLLAAPALVPAAETTVIPPVNSTSAANGADMVAAFSLRDAPFAIAIDQIAEWLDAPEVFIESELAPKGSVTINLKKAMTRKQAADALRSILVLNGVACEELSGDVLYFFRPTLREIPLRFDMGSILIRWRAHAATAETLLRRIGVWSGREIGFDSAALAGVAPITLDDGPTLQSANEMFAAAAAALRRAGLLLEEQPDGSYRARRAAQPAEAKPAKQP
jgi:hypothetical protein